MSRVAREVFEAVVLALIVFLVIQTGVRNFKVEGASMQPTLHGGQFLLVNKLVYFKLDTARISRIVPFWKVDRSSQRFALRPPNRGEVIVFHYPRDVTKDFVKRVVGLPGETVEVREGTTYIDGQPIDEPYLTTTDRSSSKLVLLDREEYYVMGDNRRGSNDSRNWGPVSEELLLGKVWFVYWPFSEMGLVHGSP
jgi:signal peptidase I